MLVLSRRVGERLVIDIPAGVARRIEVCLVELRPKQIRLGIDAGPDVEVLRGELIDAKESTAAA